MQVIRTNDQLKNIHNSDYGLGNINHTSQNDHHERSDNISEMNNQIPDENDDIENIDDKSDIEKNEILMFDKFIQQVGRDDGLDSSTRKIKVSRVETKQTNKIMNHKTSKEDRSQDVYENKIINFSYKQIYTIPQSIVKYKNIQVIKLNNNYLDKLSFSCFSFCPFLTQLDLSYNRIQQFPQSILQLKQLQLLNLQNNLIQEFPEQLGELFNLQILNIQSNPVTTLYSCYYQLNQLKLFKFEGMQMMLDNNYIKSIDIKSNMKNRLNTANNNDNLQNILQVNMQENQQTVQFLKILKFINRNRQINRLEIHYLLTFNPKQKDRFQNSFNMKILIKNENFVLLKHLIDNQIVSVNEVFGNHTLLSYTIKYKRHNLLQFLQNNYDSNINLGGGQFQTSFNLLVYQENIQQIKYYLQKQNVNLDVITNQKKKVIHLISEYNNIQNQQILLQMLLKKGLNPNQKDYNKNTIIHCLSQKGNIRLLEYVINHNKNNPNNKFDLNSLNIYGQSPLDLAISHKNQEIINYFIQESLYDELNTRQIYDIKKQVIRKIYLKDRMIKQKKEMIQILKYNGTCEENISGDENEVKTKQNEYVLTKKPNRISFQESFINSANRDRSLNINSLPINIEQIEKYQKLSLNISYNLNNNQKTKMSRDIQEDFSNKIDLFKILKEIKGDIEQIQQQLSICIPKNVFINYQLHSILMFQILEQQIKIQNLFYQNGGNKFYNLIILNQKIFNQDDNSCNHKIIITLIQEIIQQQIKNYLNNQFRLNTLSQQQSQFRLFNQFLSFLLQNSQNNKQIDKLLVLPNSFYRIISNTIQQYQMYEFYHNLIQIRRIDLNIKQKERREQQYQVSLVSSQKKNKDTNNPQKTNLKKSLQLYTHNRNPEYKLITQINQRLH